MQTFAEIRLFQDTPDSRKHALKLIPVADARSLGKEIVEVSQRRKESPRQAVQ